MAIVSGTTWTRATANSLTYGSNIREDLEDVIWELDPMDTWALTNLEKVQATATYHEWLADDLAAAAANLVREGDDATFSTAAPARRLGNYMQISNKTFIVSDTLEIVNKAGRKTETGRLGTKLLKELKRDMEFALVRNQASSLGADATARSTAGMESWIKGPTASTANTIANVVTATTTAASATTIGFASGVVTAPTDGSTTGTLSVGQLNMALAGSWEDGGDPRVILVGPTQKAVIDQFTGVATRFVDTSPRSQAPIVGAANMYVSSYGSPHMVVLSRYVRSSVVLCIDPDYWAVAFLRKPQVKDLAKTGDATKKLIVTEFGLVCRNENASSKVVACA
jgi:hypothetical protein